MSIDDDEADRQRIREEIRASRRMTDLERLQWLEEICVFTKMFQQAPAVTRPDTGTPERDPSRPSAAGARHNML